MDLAEYYEEVTKQAGFKPEVEVEDEKVAAVVAVTEQFDIDGITFESDDEKIAAAVAIVEGFEKVAGVKDMASKAKAFMGRHATNAKDAVGRGATSVKNKLMEHKKKALAAGAVGAAGAGFYAGRKSN